MYFSYRNIDFFARLLDKIDSAFGLYSLMAYLIKPQNTPNFYAYSKN
jgi:hypothetical protein